MYQNSVEKIGGYVMEITYCFRSDEIVEET